MKPQRIRCQTRLGFFNQPSCHQRGGIQSIKSINFDADWGTLDFLLIDLPPGVDVHLSIDQAVPINGAELLDTTEYCPSRCKKGVYVPAKEHQVPVLGIVENMAYFYTRRITQQSILYLW